MEETKRQIIAKVSKELLMVQFGSSFIPLKTSKKDSSCSIRMGQIIHTHDHAYLLNKRKSISEYLC
jgi:hypothetical protein